MGVFIKSPFLDKLQSKKELLSAHKYKHRQIYLSIFIPKSWLSPSHAVELFPNWAPRACPTGTILSKSTMVRFETRTEWAEHYNSPIDLTFLRDLEYAINRYIIYNDKIILSNQIFLLFISVATLPYGIPIMFILLSLSIMSSKILYLISKLRHSGQMKPSVTCHLA